MITLATWAKGTATTYGSPCARHVLRNEAEPCTLCVWEKVLELRDQQRAEAIALLQAVLLPENQHPSWCQCRECCQGRVRAKRWLRKMTGHAVR